MATFLNLLLFEWYMFSNCYGNNESFAVTITKDMLNDRILSNVKQNDSDYIFTIDEGSKQPCFHGTSAYCKWDTIYVNYWDYSDMKMKLNPNTQQIEFYVHDVSMRSNPFQFIIQENVHSMQSIGNASLNINHWNFSFNMHFEAVEIYLNITSCFSGNYIEENSITIQQTDELSVIYAIIGDISKVINDDRVRQLFNYVIFNYMNGKLSTDIQAIFQWNVPNVISLGIAVSNMSCFAVLNVYATLMVNLSYNHVDINNTQLFGQMSVEQSVSIPSDYAEHWILYTCFVILIAVFTCIGTVTSYYWCYSRIMNYNIHHSTEYHVIQENTESIASNDERSHVDENEEEEEKQPAPNQFANQSQTVLDHLEQVRILLMEVNNNGNMDGDNGTITNSEESGTNSNITDDNTFATEYSHLGTDSQSAKLYDCV